MVSSEKDFIHQVLLRVSWESWICHIVNQPVLSFAQGTFIKASWCQDLRYSRGRNRVIASPVWAGCWSHSLSELIFFHISSLSSKMTMWNKPTKRPWGSTCDVLSPRDPIVPCHLHFEESRSVFPLLGLSHGNGETLMSHLSERRKGPNASERVAWKALRPCQAPVAWTGFSSKFPEMKSGFF